MPPMDTDWAFQHRLLDQKENNVKSIAATRPIPSKDLLPKTTKSSDTSDSTSSHTLVKQINDETKSDKKEMCEETAKRIQPAKVSYTNWICCQCSKWTDHPKDTCHRLLSGMTLVDRASSESRRGNPFHSIIPYYTIPYHILFPTILHGHNLLTNADSALCFSRDDNDDMIEKSFAAYDWLSIGVLDIQNIGMDHTLSRIDLAVNQSHDSQTGAAANQVDFAMDPYNDPLKRLYKARFSTINLGLRSESVAEKASPEKFREEVVAKDQSSRTPTQSTFAESSVQEYDEESDGETTPTQAKFAYLPVQRASTGGIPEPSKAAGDSATIRASTETFRHLASTDAFSSNPGTSVRALKRGVGYPSPVVGEASSSASDFRAVSSLLLEEHLSRRQSSSRFSLLEISSSFKEFRDATKEKLVKKSKVMQDLNRYSLVEAQPSWPVDPSIVETTGGLAAKPGVRIATQEEKAMRPPSMGVVVATRGKNDGIWCCCLCRQWTMSPYAKCMRARPTGKVMPQYMPCAHIKCDACEEMTGWAESAVTKHGRPVDIRPLCDSPKQAGRGRRSEPESGGDASEVGPGISGWF
ncbi:unnamed protein product [Diplocarpon coronariae]